MNIIAKILLRYDIVLIQEIRDNSNHTMSTLMDTIHSISGKPYSYVISERLGRTVSKEQYAYVYNQEILSVVSTYQYPDPQDYFERSPFSVHIRPNGAVSSEHDLFFVGIHVKPSDAVAEIDHLVDLHEDYTMHDMLPEESRRIAKDRVIFMGDFNGGCSYVTTKHWNEIRLRTQTDKYEWLIKDTASTVVTDKACAYDRFVISKSLLMPHADSDDAGAQFFNTLHISAEADVFRFKQAFKLSDEECRKISDHYPIELSINFM